ncbi:histidinol dehydrogenase [Candidatus Raskinella chloraquaticus]|uniref:Histidinol dehydrogenase n=1 Tax=Candidatus Raskinella chloraquaticus TaxID=1951219 RepID=A0A1W9I2M9_9HYPH|nr:MAG: histidinol dehydrogenase [Proteobacteria bacterium SG_bin8]
MPVRLNAATADFAASFATFLEGRREDKASVDAVVAEIIAAVRHKGDAAVLAYSARFDGASASTMAQLRVPAATLAASAAGVPAATFAALELAARRIRAYHEQQKPLDHEFTDALGVELGWRWRPVDAAGLYVPGGTAAYPSSVLMNAIPAKVAGVERLVMTVPAPGGRVAPLVLAAAHLAGIDEVWTIGGAQAIAALAYGTASLAPVAKIVGPGNAYVASAKKQVFGDVGIDMMAGPSEVLVIADASANPAWIAADLLAQAEHDERAQAILITDHPPLAAAVEAAVDAQLADLPRQAIAAPSWRDFGAIIVVAEIADAIPLANLIAAEHLELIGATAERLSPGLRHAGAIFFGAMTPEAVGDYIGGSNHVLPTSRSARFSSGLGVLDFMKRTSLLRCPPSALASLGPAAVALAEAEGLEAHARSLRLRLAALSGE